MVHSRPLPTMRALRFRCLLALLGCLAVSGCAAPIETADAGFAAGSRSGFAAAGVGAQGSSGADRYLAVRAKRRATSGLAFARVPSDLWAPFRAETLMGVLDPVRLKSSDGAITCLELDARASNPLRFYGICAQRTNGGLLVYAYTHLSGSPVGDEFYPGATEVEVAIESNGITLSYFSREPGEGWDTLAAHAFQEGDPLHPALGASSLGPNAETGFDNFRITQNGDSPDALRPEQELSRQIWLAAPRTLDALYALDGANPDFGTAQSALDDYSHPLIQAALTTANATDLGDKKRNKKARSSLQKALGAAAKASDRVGQGNADKAVKEVLKVLDGLMNAAVAAYPEADPP